MSVLVNDSIEKILLLKRLVDFETVPTVGSYFAFYFIAVRFISNRFNNSIFSIESLTKTDMLVVF
jgi:hypothetical protein